MRERDYDKLEREGGFYRLREKDRGWDSNKLERMKEVWGAVWVGLDMLTLNVSKESVRKRLSF
jgi:hypothetical protein